MGGSLDLQRIASGARCCEARASWPRGGADEGQGSPPAAATATYLLLLLPPLLLMHYNDTPLISSGDDSRHRKVGNGRELPWPNALPRKHAKDVGARPYPELWEMLDCHGHCDRLHTILLVCVLALFAWHAWSFSWVAPKRHL